uniref:Uncharacterized protein n=1 Tax=Acrobeloides nanus TaxID=290746 RepID=A0A914CC88_9BILA
MYISNTRTSIRNFGISRVFYCHTNACVAGCLCQRAPTMDTKWFMAKLSNETEWDVHLYLYFFSIRF